MEGKEFGQVVEQPRRLVFTYIDELTYIRLEKAANIARMHPEDYLRKVIEDAHLRV